MRRRWLIAAVVVAAVAGAFALFQERPTSAPRTTAPASTRDSDARPPTRSAPSGTPKLPLTSKPSSGGAPRPDAKAIRDVVRPALPHGSNATDGSNTTGGNVEARSASREGEAACVAKDAAAAQRYYEQASPKARLRISLACAQVGITLEAPPPRPVVSVPDVSR